MLVSCKNKIIGLSLEDSFSLAVLVNGENKLHVKSCILLSQPCFPKAACLFLVGLFLIAYLIHTLFIKHLRIKLSLLTSMWFN